MVKMRFECLFVYFLPRVNWFIAFCISFKCITLIHIFSEVLLSPCHFSSFWNRKMVDFSRRLISFSFFIICLDPRSMFNIKFSLAYSKHEMRSVSLNSIAKYFWTNDIFKMAVRKRPYVKPLTCQQIRINFILFTFRLIRIFTFQRSGYFHPFRI